MERVSKQVERMCRTLLGRGRSGQLVARIMLPLGLGLEMGKFEATT